MATIQESAERLVGPDWRTLVDLLHGIRSNDVNLRKPAKNLLHYTINRHPNRLLHKFLATIERTSITSSRACVLCYDVLRIILPLLWTKISLNSRNELKVSLISKIMDEQDYDILKACSSCVSRLACLLLPINEWNDLLVFMFRNLRGSGSWNRKMGALFLWNQLIPKCPQVFLPYVDRLIVKGFKDHMNDCTVSEDYQCGVLAAKASVKLIVYFGIPELYSEFYDLFAYVITTLIVALGEEGLVYSLLEDLIVLGRVNTAFLKAQNGGVVESMVNLAANSGLGEMLRKLAIEFVVTVAEDRESGCEVMQMVSKDCVSRLLLVLIDMLVYVEDDPSWGNAINDDGNEGESSMCSYGKESLDRLAIALGGNVIVPNLPLSLFTFFDHEKWQIRSAAVTTIGVISEGCSDVIVISSKDMEYLVENTVKLICDKHTRVQWAAIQAIAQMSMYLNRQFHEQYHQQVLPALIEVLDDFDNPRLQTRATSAILLFSLHCSADILKPYLHSIVRKLVVFLQRGKAMMIEAALETLASLAIPSQEDAAHIYDSVMPYMRIILLTADDDDTNPMLLAKSVQCITTIMMAKSVQCITTITKAFGQKVTAALISLQKTHMEEEDPLRCLLLQAWDGVCQCLGAKFIPYLSVALPFVLKSATLKNYLSVSSDSDDDSDDESAISVTAGNKKVEIRSPLLKEKAMACHTLCSFAAELEEGLHLWINEVLSALVPNLTFEFSEDVRMAAIAAMPLLLNSAACAVKKGLPVTDCGKSPVQKISDTIIPALLDALNKESKVQIQARLLEAFNESIQIPGSRLSKDQAIEFVDGMSRVLSTCSYHKTEIEKRAKGLKDQRGHEADQQHLTICRSIRKCLGTMVKRLKASFFPLFDKFLPYLSLMWSNDRTAEQRRIVVYLFFDIVEQCREEVFRYYEEWISLLPRVYYHKNPDVPQIVATAISIIAEFGADFVKPHTTVIFNRLKTVMEHPNAKDTDNIMAYEASVSACGKLNKFVFEGITYAPILLWLNHLPIMCNLHEAKISHELLCSMVETSEQKVIGPGGSYVPIITAIFAEVLWAGNNLATKETTRRIVNLLKKFQRKIQPTIWSIILDTLPLPHQNMLRIVLSNAYTFV